ncbi:type II toxin-antitoxin system RelE/ParE family toxin [Desulfobulbus sp. F5]|nr:type II toxin-antitoxin system RelE/ParE family toxin [Desulfobulbus sp. F5]
MTHKKIEFVGTSLRDLKRFPRAAMQDAGYQLEKVQRGSEPDDWKTFPAVGAGVKEIRIQDEGGIFRVMYVAKFDDAVYVLHAFQKKTEKTRKADVDVAKERYEEILRRKSS